MRELYRVAWHEAGHAIAAFHYRRPIRLVTADVEGTGATRCLELKADARSMFRGRVWRQLVQQEIVICLAGPIAEEIEHGDAESAEIDLQMARKWLAELMMQEDLALVMLCARTRQLLRDPQTWNAVGQVARRLIQGRKITGAEVERICQALKVPRVGNMYSPLRDRLGAARVNQRTIFQ